jgi:hypothetical protein
MGARTDVGGRAFGLMTEQEEGSEANVSVRGRERVQARIYCVVLLSAHQTRRWFETVTERWGTIARQVKR